MQDTPEQVEDAPEPANLRFLRLLVTVLTAVMIVGLVVLLTLVVIRVRTPQPILPDTIALPAGTSAQAYTQGDGWLAVVTQDNRILFYTSDGSTLLKELDVDLPSD